MYNGNRQVIHLSLDYKYQSIYSQSIKDCLYLIKFVLRCLYIEDDNIFMFLTEIKNVGKPDVEIDVKYSERDRTVRYGWKETFYLVKIGMCRSDRINKQISSFCLTF
jgi:hypothetical protein